MSNNNEIEAKSLRGNALSDCTQLPLCDVGYQTGREGFVYVVACHNYIKIGIASDFKARMSVLQVGNPYEIKTVNLFFAQDAKEAERKLHDRFWAYRSRGEWFEMPQRLIDALGRIESLDELRIERRCQL